MTQATATRWTVSGEYFENCNCDVVCPCEIGAKGFMQARPDQGQCAVWLVFHLNSGSFGDTDLGGLNAVLAVLTPGVMGEGNWTIAAYIDAQASAAQQQALGAIFGGAAGGPMAALTPLIGQNLGAKVVPISYRREGKKRSATIDGILDSTIEAVRGATADGVVVKRGANPLFPDEWVQAYGVRGTFRDHDWNWDNSGKCADYADFTWSGQ